MRLDARQRQLSALVYLQDLLEPRRNGHFVLVGPTDQAGDDRHKQLLRSTQLTRAADARHLGVPDGAADVVLALEVDASTLEAVADEAKRALKPDGVLVLGCASKDRPGARSGASYYDLVDRLEARFPSVTMIGEAPFAGATLVEYGVKDPEPMLDGTLVDKGERVEFYLALASRTKLSAGGYTVVQLPATEPVTQAQAPAPVATRAPTTAKPVDKAPPLAVAELEERLRQREKAVEEFRSAALKHLGEMEQMKALLRERDAYVAELEGDARHRDRLRDEARRASERADQAEARERQARLELAQCQGRLLRAGQAAAPAPMIVGDAQLAERVRELEAENGKLKQKEEEARAESWKHLKARSDAEAQAAEVREDTVRKLKDARKLASVELTRAMEEASRKAVSLKDELDRTLRERKELLKEIERLKALLANGAATATTTASGNGSDERAELEAERERAAQLGELVRQLEAEVTEARRSAASGQAAQSTAVEAAQVERERWERMLASVESEAKKRAETAVRMRQALKDREREVEQLRREIADRDAQLVALDKQRGQSDGERDGVERLASELQEARAKLAELGAELQKREAATERAAAAAAHERARAERLVAEERRALADRNEARAKLAQAEARAQALEHEKERIEHALAEARVAEARLDEELRDRKERQKQLKRDLEDAERRAAQLETARERLGAMENALRGEEQRMASMEEALRRAARELSSQNGTPGEST